VDQSNLASAFAPQLRCKLYIFNPKEHKTTSCPQSKCNLEPVSWKWMGYFRCTPTASGLILLILMTSH